MKIPRFIALMLCLAPLAWAAQTDLVGHWKSKDGKETQIFTGDGRFTSIASEVGVRGRYECDGDTLVLRLEGEGAPPKIVRKFKVAGDTLSLEDPATHEVQELKRVDEKGAKQVPEPTPAQRAVAADH